jgi:hypothetical protein
LSHGHDGGPGETEGKPLAILKESGAFFGNPLLRRAEEPEGPDRRFTGRGYRKDVYPGAFISKCEFLR